MKYMGNKRRIADDILNAIFANSEPAPAFVDLFCGSCSVIGRLPTDYRKTHRCVANDKNVFLVEMLKQLLIDDSVFPRTIPRDVYSSCRDVYNKAKKDGTELLPNDVAANVGWVGWMASFNGRFFSGGYSGHEVVIASGAKRDYITENINDTVAQIESLRDIEFMSSDYRDVLIEEGSIVYCDIPYRGTKQYETSKNFDYDEFYDWCDRNRHDYQIFVSEYAMPDDFECIWKKELTCALNQKNTYKPIEKLFRIC